MPYLPKRIEIRFCLTCSLLAGSILAEAASQPLMDSRNTTQAPNGIGFSTLEDVVTNPEYPITKLNCRLIFLLRYKRQRNFRKVPVFGTKVKGPVNKRLNEIQLVKYDVGSLVRYRNPVTLVVNIQNHPSSDLAYSLCFRVEPLREDHRQYDLFWFEPRTPDVLYFRRHPLRTHCSADFSGLFPFLLGSLRQCTATRIGKCWQLAYITVTTVETKDDRPDRLLCSVISFHYFPYQIARTAS